MANNKYLTLGSLLEGKDGDYIELDLSNLKEFVGFLQKFGNSHLKGLSVDDIRAKVKAKELGRLYVSLYDTRDGAPAFIKKNLVVKLNE